MDNKTFETLFECAKSNLAAAKNNTTTLKIVYYKGIVMGLIYALSESPLTRIQSKMVSELRKELNSYNPVPSYGDYENETVY